MQGSLSHSSERFLIDSSPAMSLIAAGRVAARHELGDLTTGFVISARGIRADEPLSMWFSEGSASFLRAIARSLLHPARQGPNSAATPLTITGFRFTALALTLRQLLSKEASSNPTWFRQ